MNCARCGAPLEDGAQFCTSCGTVQQAADQSTISPVPAATPIPVSYNDQTGAQAPSGDQYTQPMTQPMQPVDPQPQQPYGQPQQPMAQPVQPVPQPVQAAEMQPMHPAQPVLPQQPYDPASQPYGQAPQPYGQVPPPFSEPPKKSSNKTLFIILGIVAVLVIGGIIAFFVINSGSGGADNPTPPPVVQDNPTGNDNPPPPTTPDTPSAETISGDVTGQVGKAYATRWFTFTVEDMSTSPSIPEHSAAAGNILVIAEITLTNTSGSSQPFGTFDWLVDDDSLAEYIYPLELNSIDSKFMPDSFTLADGETATYIVVIEFPENLANPYFMYIEADDKGQTYSTFRIPITK